MFDLYIRVNRTRLEPVYLSFFGLNAWTVGDKIAQTAALFLGGIASVEVSVRPAVSKPSQDCAQMTCDSPDEEERRAVRGARRCQGG